MGFITRFRKKKGYQRVKKLSASLLATIVLLLSSVSFAFASAPSSAPTNVLVPNIYGTSAMVTWTASTDTINTAGYNIYVDGVKKSAVGKVSSATISGLTGVTNYSVTVTARDSAGLESQLSVAKSFTTLASTAPIAMNFDMSSMFQYAQMILDVMMPVLYITIGISLGFIIIRALKSAFN